MTSLSELRSGYVMPTLIASAVTPGARVSLATSVVAEPDGRGGPAGRRAALLDLQPATASSISPAVATAAHRVRRRDRHRVDDTTSCSFVLTCFPLFAVAGASTLPACSPRRGV